MRMLSGRGALLEQAHVHVPAVEVQVRPVPFAPLRCRGNPRPKKQLGSNRYITWAVQEWTDLASGFGRLR